MEPVKVQTREIYGKTLAELAKIDKNVVAMDCDLGQSTKAYDITSVDPSRFIEMGISEQDMISTAAGLSRMGKIVFANSFAIFITGRAFDQIRQQVSLANTNVKICGSSAGITQGPDGATHQSVLDLSLMRSLPNMTVLHPADGIQTEKAVRAAYEINGPVYLRLSRFVTGNFTDKCDFVVGKAETLRTGHDIAICATGPITWNVLKACELLDKQGFNPALVNFHTVKPIDVEVIHELAGEFSHMFTVEEHSIYGGLGSAVAEVISESPAGTSKLKTFRRIGIADHYGESGTAGELLAKYKLDAEGIASTIIEVVRS
jgi:transketolase